MNPLTDLANTTAGAGITEAGAIGSGNLGLIMQFSIGIALFLLVAGVVFFFIRKRG